MKAKSDRVDKGKERECEINAEMQSIRARFLELKTEKGEILSERKTLNEEMESWMS